MIIKKVPRGTQGDPGGPRGTQGDPGGPRGTQGDPGGPRGTQGDPGGPRGTQGDPGGPRGTQGDPGGPRGTQGRFFLWHLSPSTSFTTLSLLYIPLPCIPFDYGYCVFSESYICEQYLVTCRKKLHLYYVAATLKLL